jgi:hypothetical protein
MNVTFTVVFHILHTIMSFSVLRAGLHEASREARQVNK